MINNDSFIENFKEILDDPDQENISTKTVFKELDEWDSLTNLSLLTMIDSEFNVKLNADDIRNSNTIMDLVNLINSKLK